MTKLNLSAKDILQKEFKSKVRGYDPVEVDEFLDTIIKDYETYNQELLALKEENHRLVNKVDQLTQSQATLSRMKQEVPNPSSVTNFDILKRLSNLEKEVFGKKLEQPSSSSSVSMNEQARESLSSVAQKFLDNEDLGATRRY
ncbi:MULTISPECIES: cell division regulator GpsB [Enterococcaceae]|uniref:cell division regulator GpsB n=1 Tax=Enterococcaceae TaxID=81852 RepID=UPI000E4D2457|nr:MULTISPECIES: cell division regulator GpsB [Enterococcaceae]MCI0130660.1 cell division regulator GpsB [Vagococcus sp. CY53-2]RGI32367.1 cell division regulator GpsB [Melissococcus sp. OM08-11BH]UNM90082.1 cell division regulator GpsB [Vagococcus sp. CY52-2]